MCKVGFEVLRNARIVGRGMLRCVCVLHNRLIDSPAVYARNCHRMGLVSRPNIVDIQIRPIRNASDSTNFGLNSPGNSNSQVDS